MTQITAEAVCELCKARIPADDVAARWFDGLAHLGCALRARRAQAGESWGPH